MLSNLKSNPSHQRLSLCFIRKISALFLLFVCSEPVMFCVFTWGCGRRRLLPSPHANSGQYSSHCSNEVQEVSSHLSLVWTLWELLGLFGCTAPSKAGSACGVGVDAQDTSWAAWGSQRVMQDGSMSWCSSEPHCRRNCITVLFHGISYWFFGSVYQY